MNFFQRLFSTKSETVELDQHLPPQDLFMTDETPEPEEKQSAIISASKLEILMNQNFEPEGYRDGYEEHDLDTMEMQVQSISAQFKNAIRVEVKSVADEMSSVEPHLTERVKELMQDQYFRLQSKYDALRLKKAELEAEMELANEEKGYCELAMKKYRLGFIKGFRFWSDEIHFSNNL
jgi:hypothetical protein